MMPAPLLLVCRTERAWHARGLLPPGQPVVVASNDPRVHVAARSCPGVTDVIYLEPLSSSFYSVAAEVRRAVGLLDEWMAGFAPEFSEALRWGCTVEGGLTSQRVQDALLLIDATHDLFDRVQPAGIIVHSTGAARFDDRVLVSVAGARGIPCRLATPNRWKRGLDAIQAWLRPASLLTYRLVHLFRRGGGRLTPRVATAPGIEGSVLFVLCSSARNHAVNVQSLILELVRQGTGCAVLTWCAHERMPWPPPEELLPGTTRLEPWLGWRDVATCLGRARRLHRRIARATDTPWPVLTYRGVPLSPLLSESVRHFLIAELPLRLMFRHALLAAIGSRLPVAVKPWGAPEGFEYRQISRLWPDDHRPLMFQYWLGVGMPWPYADPLQRVDLFLAKCQDEAAQVAADYRLPDTALEIVGQIRLAGHREFADTTTVAQSRSVLGLGDIPDTLWVGFDPNCALRGYQSAREQAAITESLLAAVAEAPGLHLLVKPHPAYPIDHLAPLFAAADPARVHVLPARCPLDHFLNAADLMVSKYSTLLVEAALMRRVAVPVIPDGDGRFRVFGELAPVLTDPADLTRLLTDLAGHPARRNAWIADRLRQQEEYLRLNFHPAPGPTAVARAATAILTHAVRHQRR